MVTADKSRFNRRRMYLISNEFTLPAFSGGPAAPHRRGFYLVKKGFARVEHRRNSESSLEFNSRTRASGGGSRLPPWLPSLFVPLVSHYPQQLLVFIFRIRSLPYVYVYGEAENEATEEMSRRAWRFSRILKRYQLFVPGVAQLANGGSAGHVTWKYSQEVCPKCGVNGGDVRVGYKVRTVFWWSSALRLIPLTGAKEYYFSANE